ncbi:hypothetical protein [Candidatus Mycoplasma haematominutum]|uniref:Uncharacterized protein n=1 Tax=Candidatus Mycoplasma haematominutum 'Birmingham 1' TaxID=1116213 RepID=G8C2Y2_9MOLU|nr:hypothetical protein [Candidatus Mycoplasma haematominutum]CCE66680.1 conserved haemoplasma hypothetical protein [Candidatus Mycoplasma haematominutum 'Birmingham 1']
MSLIKPFFGLQTAILASNSVLTDTATIDSSKLISENQTKNQKYKDEKKSLFDNPDTENGKKLDLFLPVNLVIFDNYYKRLSEWKYFDKYTYKDRVLVFNSKEHQQPLSPSDDFYKDEWLDSLEHSKEYKYQDTYMYQYPEKRDENNISWIDGGASDHKLRNLLSLNAPKKIESPFETHKKSIELDQSFFMSPTLNHYAGYWKKGTMNADNNLIKNVTYGKLKHKYKNAQDVFYGSSTKTLCERFEDVKNIDLRNSREEAEEEGFDAKCDQIDLLRFWSFFYNRRTKSIFSSGYVGHKTIKPASWNTHYYFYFLGNWVLDKPSSTQVNDEKGEQNLWYVNFDNVFVPDIKYVENSATDGAGKKGELQMSIYIDYSKIPEKNLDTFFKVASSLKYKLKFRVNSEEKEVKFTLKEVLESKSFSLSMNTEFVNLENKSNLAFSNFEFATYSDNSKIQLSSRTGTNEFKFEVNLQLIQQQFNVFRKIITRQEALKNFYYSELKKKQRLDEIFYFAVKKPKEAEYMLYKLTDKWINLLNLEFLGNDLSSSAVVKYYDFLEGKEKQIESSELLTLPNFEHKEFSKTEKYSSLPELVSSQLSQTIGKYFWDNVELKMESKDILDGVEEYSLSFKAPVKDEDAWDAHYKNTRLKVKNSLKKYLIPNANASNIGSKISTNELSSLFTINSSEGDDLKLSLSDFSFKKVGEDQDFVEIEVEYINKQELTLASETYKDVKLKGKNTFKLNKRENYVSLNTKDTSPTYFYSSAVGEFDRNMNRSSGGVWNDPAIIPTIVSSLVAGGGVTAGAGALLSKKLKFAL